MKLTKAVVVENSCELELIKIIKIFLTKYSI